jgi:hypothetical protein
MSKNMFHKAKEMQKKLSRVEEEMGTLEVTGSAGNGVVVATVDGKQKLKRIYISPELIDPGEVDILEDLVLIAVNEAIEKSQKLVSERLTQITGGLKGV